MLYECISEEVKFTVDATNLVDRKIQALALHCLGLTRTSKIEQAVQQTCSQVQLRASQLTSDP